jgi:hypothetical protein
MMSKMMTPKYEDEDRIIWLKDRDALANMGYVRERWRLSSIRTGPAKPRRERCSSAMPF